MNKFIFANPKATSVMVAWILYFITRYLLTYYYNFKTIGVGTEYFKDQINNLPIGIWSGLEGFWVVILLSFIVLFYHKNKWFLFAYGISILIIIFVALSVIDITRSMAYLLPSIFISLNIVYRVESKSFNRYLSLAVLVLCLFPTYYVGGRNTIQLFYPLPLQLIRIINF